MHQAEAGSQAIASCAACDVSIQDDHSTAAQTRWYQQHLQRHVHACLLPDCCVFVPEAAAATCSWARQVPSRLSADTSSLAVLRAGVQWQVRADWRYNAENEDVDYDRTVPSGKPAVARHTFLPTEGEGYYDEEDMYEDSDEQGEFYGGRSASRSGYGAYGMPAGGSHTSMRHAAGLGRAASGAAEVGVSQLSSTATSDTSQQQASRLGSTTGNLLSLRQPSRLVVQVDARPTSK
jgi:hypothetical protein